MEIIKKQNSAQSENYKIIDHYAIPIKKVIGKGAFGVVYRGLDLKTKQEIAVKSISLHVVTKDSDKMIQNLRSEISVMRILNHQNVVKLLDVKKSPNNLYLIMEFCNQGSLDVYLKEKNNKISEYEAIKITKEIVQGFKCLYQNNIVHRDLKPANILLHDGQCKIADFGFSKAIDHGMNTQCIVTQVGSPLYMSPQILKGETYSSKTDIWSLGFMLYQMIYKYTPWTGRSPCDLLNNILIRPLKFPDEETKIVNQDIKKILSSMLEIDEAKRISWNELFKLKIFMDDAELFQQSVRVLDSDKNLDKLARSKALNQIYFDQNRVIQSPYECIKMENMGQSNLKEKKEEIITNNEQQQLNHEKEPDSLEDMFEDKNKEITKQQMVRNISSWVLHRRNKAVFLNYLSLQLHDFVVQKKLALKSDMYYRFIFIFSKYQMMILYKIYQRLKSGQNPNQKKFTSQQWTGFVESQDRNLLLGFIKNDIQIIKMFFNEFMQKTKNYIQKVEASNDFSSDIKQKMKTLEQICNNMLCDKSVFQNLYDDLLSEFVQFLKLQVCKITKPDEDKNLLIFSNFVLKAADIRIQFKWDPENKIDFNSFYEEIQKLNHSKLLLNIISNRSNQKIERKLSYEGQQPIKRLSVEPAQRSSITPKRNDQTTPIKQNPDQKLFSLKQNEETTAKPYQIKKERPSSVNQFNIQDKIKEQQSISEKIKDQQKSIEKFKLLVNSRNNSKEKQQLILQKDTNVNDKYKSPQKYNSNNVIISPARNSNSYKSPFK